MKKMKESVKRDIVIQAPIEKVWAALTKPEHLNRWYTKESFIDFRVGGKGKMNHGWGATSSGIFTEIIEFQKFVLESDDGEFKTITSLEEVDGGIRVTIEYETTFVGEDGEAAKENMLFGTYQFLKNLKSVFESNTDLRSNYWKTWIGLHHTTFRSKDDRMGSKVLNVHQSSPANVAGILPGDVITKIDDELVVGYESLENIIQSKRLNDQIRITLMREGKVKELRCFVTSYPVPY